MVDSKYERCRFWPMIKGWDIIFFACLYKFPKLQSQQMDHTNWRTHVDLIQTNFTMPLRNMCMFKVVACILQERTHTYAYSNIDNDKTSKCKFSASLRATLLLLHKKDICICTYTEWAHIWHFCDVPSFD